MECGSGELEVDHFVVLPSAVYERLGRIQNGGIVVLLSAALVAEGSGTDVVYWWGHDILMSLAVSAPTPM